MSFAVHAAPPPGEWLNDPNGLAFIDGQWRLFVQHSAAAPDFRAIGWARLSSPDLLHWSWDGPVIAPDALGQAYSGSITCENGDLAAYLTRHDGTVQRQVRLTSSDSGAAWTQGPVFGPAGRNVRDPFVFFCAATNDWRMLVAEPCDWTDWAHDPPSTLAVWRRDGGEWVFVSRIGPWDVAGILWEVPVLVDFGACQVMMISTVDRRDGSSACAVRYWPGIFDGADFTPANPGPGLLLDHGPDFYAAIVDCATTRGPAPPTLVAWASSWATARAMPWPGGTNGGPITMPRTLRFDAPSGRLVQAPVAGAVPLSSIVWAGPEPITVTGEDCTLSIMRDDTGLIVLRKGLAGLLDWERRDQHCFAAGVEQTIDIFNDAGLIEIFIRPAGVTITAFVPNAVI
jgi:fructan beta-fructosidase